MPRLKGRRPRIHASLEMVDPDKLEAQHKVNYRELFKIARKQLDGDGYPGPWTLPPVLVCRDRRSMTLYDGHHRTAIGHILSTPEIPAYVFPRFELNAVVARYFDGVEHTNYWELDPYIILPDGTRYEDAGIRT